MKKKIISILFFILIVSNSNFCNSEIIFQDDFESGTLLTSASPAGKWDSTSNDCNNSQGCAVCDSPATPRITSTYKHSGSYAAEYHYKLIKYDGTNCTALHRDQNEYLKKTFSTNYHHVFMRFYAMWPANTPYYDGHGDGVSKKWHRLQSTNIYNGNNNGYETFISTVLVNTSQGVPPNGWKVMPTYNSFTQAGGMICPGSCPLNGGGCSSGNITTLELWSEADRLIDGNWHCWELEVWDKTGNTSDEVRIWLDGTLLYECTTWDLKGNSPDYGYSIFTLGQQVDRPNGGAYEEWRYIDDVVISTERIGPISTTDYPPGPPAIPSNLRIVTTSTTVP